MECRLLEGFLEQGLSLEQIGALIGRHPSTVSYWLRKYDLQPVYKQKHAARGGIDQTTLERLIETGASTREIAETLRMSIGTVRHWLRRYGLRTCRSQARELRARLPQVREKTVAVEMHCHRHGSSQFRLEGRGIYRCLRCRSEHVARRRRRIKAALVREAGGQCLLCGYDRFIGALHFHHLDRSKKSFALSGRGLTRSFERARDEASKCVLLCSNCHAEVEAGLAPLEVAKV